MSRVTNYRGQIIVKNEFQPGDGVYLAKDGRIGDALADEFGWHYENSASPQIVTARWAIREKNEWPETLDEVAADYLMQIDGALVSDYGDRYSEITGYLWTDETLKIGGHDLIDLFSKNAGKYLWLEVVWHE